MAKAKAKGKKRFKKKTPREIDSMITHYPYERACERADVTSSIYASLHHNKLASQRNGNSYVV